ncbi:hypothetical protein RJ641_021350 [Dillenia turbinata]|uniref:Sec-independent protein translocase protein TatB n=1 Tax=Dillenia turbinata TaxID=194707 RepID=A0AAN8UJQ1_9MAGN
MTANFSISSSEMLKEKLILLVPRRYSKACRYSKAWLSLQSRMFGISYGELFLLVAATAALVGPKDLPLIARTAGRLAGRAIGYVQLFRGQFENVMQQSQARQVHKELQDTMAQLEAIRYEIRSISLVNPGPLTRRLMDVPSQDNPAGSLVSEKHEDEHKSKIDPFQVPISASANLHNQAISYAKLAESAALQTDSAKDSLNLDEVSDGAGLLAVLPVSAETAGLLPKHSGGLTGSNIMLEAIVEAEVANNAKEFFSQPQNQIQSG